MSAPICDEPDDACLGEKGWVKYVENKQGLTLCRYFWPAEGKPKAVVLLVHGHACYAQFEFLNIAVRTLLPYTNNRHPWALILERSYWLSHTLCILCLCFLSVQTMARRSVEHENMSKAPLGWLLVEVGFDLGNGWAGTWRAGVVQGLLYWKPQQKWFIGMRAGSSEPWAVWGCQGTAMLCWKVSEPCGWCCGFGTVSGCGLLQDKRGSVCIELWHWKSYAFLPRWVSKSKDAAGFSKLPLFILGISLGGCIAVHAIHQQVRITCINHRKVQVPGVYTS